MDSDTFTIVLFCKELLIEIHRSYYMCWCSDIFLSKHIKTRPIAVCWYRVKSLSANRHRVPDKDPSLYREDAQVCPQASGPSLGG